MTDLEERQLRAVEISKDIRNLLAGHSPDVQGAVLASLLGTWLSGFLSRQTTKAATRQVRERVLAIHVKQVWKLVDAISKDEWPE